ncbi:MAG TPA: aminotransferase class V-fold PLP-dependent enzyme, partial [Acidimicrobiales bacterium]|nr:aminotransferase class V-fold PLP-dependent enzyme [Acidimicrobiales bacterium]
AAVGARVARLRDELRRGLLSAVRGLWVTVPDGVEVLPGHLHLCVPGADREEVLVALGREGVCVSGGSSCASGALEPSYVLAAMGVERKVAEGSLRFTLGPATTEAHVARALEVVPAVVERLRRTV